MKIGYHASHEQFRPSELLEYVRLAERAGFHAAMCSDHITPFSERQGQSGFAWSWIAAALQATTSIPMGLVCAPGQRYHPAVIAQAAATLAEMYPGRFWAALGSGEYLNEHVTGDGWPEKDVRRERLEEAAHVIAELLTGERVTHRGFVTAEQARLYVRPSEPPRIIAAAISAETAGWAGGWADGLITIAQQDRASMAEVVEAFRGGGGAGKPVYLQAQVCYAASDEQARTEAFERWPTAALAPDLLADLRLPADVDAALKNVRPEDVWENMRISSDLDQHVAWLREDATLGYEIAHVHNVGRDQRAFIEAYGDYVLPALARAGVTPS